MASTLKPLDHNTEINQNGQNLLKEFQETMENVTEEEMLTTLEKQHSNRLWTEEEQACLLYFHDQVKGDFDTLQSKYFKHRTVGALQVRYSKILNGHATPSHTPRPSLGNLTKKGANAVINLLTPEVNKECAKPTDENLEDLLNELEFDDDDEEDAENEEEKPAEAETEEEATPATPAETAAPEIEENEIAEEIEQEEENDDEENMIFFMLLPFIVLLMAIPLLLVADENVADTLLVQKLQTHFTEIKEYVQTFFEQ